MNYCNVITTVSDYLSKQNGEKCALKDVKTLSKENRGAYDGAKAKFKGKEIFVTRWKDNAVLTLASSLYGVEPLGTKKRWSKTERKHIYIDTPFVECQYNKNMGGTDRMDQNINAYRVSIRGKKWWWCLFTLLLDVSITNAWILFQAKEEAQPQIDFRRSIVHSYMNSFGNPPKRVVRRSVALPSTIEMRYDGLNHCMEPTEGNKRRRCAYELCTSIGRTQSSKCKVGLCVKCCVDYHTK